MGSTIDFFRNDESRKDFFLAQSEIVAVGISKTHYNSFGKYYYADLPDILSLINPTAEKNNFRVFQELDFENMGGGDLNLFGVVKTILIHNNGAWFETKTRIPFEKKTGMSIEQSAGSLFTYGRKYVLCSLFGVSAEDDTDGQNPKGDDKKPSRQPQTPKNRQCQPEIKVGNCPFPGDSEIQKMINESDISSDKKESLWTQYQGKPDNLKQSFLTGCILPQIKNK